MNASIIMLIVILAIAISMSMVGKGGGNFYVIALVLAGISMHQAATTSQLIMMATSATSMIIFNKHKKVDWKLAVMIEVPTAIMAFVGGYYAGGTEAFTLKLMFSVLFALISLFMLLPVKDKPIIKKDTPGYWHRKYGGYEYTVNLWLILPITAAVGFFAGAIGISGGAFKVPLMVLLCGVPMEIAVGTSTAMVATTAMMGFAGHMVNGSFDPAFAFPLVIAAVVGGIIGSKCAVRSKPKNLKKIFAATNLLAAVIMAVNMMS